MLYSFKNGPMQTTAGHPKVTTGTAIKTMLQVKMGATTVGRVTEWHVSMDASAAATPVLVELIEVDVAATVTAFVANDITKLDGDALMAGNPTTDFFEVGVSASGYTATAEGTVTASRDLDIPQLISPTNQFIVKFALGEEPVIQAAKFARIRVTAGAAVNMICGFKIKV